MPWAGVIMEIPESMSSIKKFFLGLISVIPYAGGIGGVWLLGILAIFQYPLSILFEPISMILFAGWIGGVGLLQTLAMRRYHRVYRLHWYDLSAAGPNGEMNWCQVRCLMEKDARPSGCPSWCWKPQRYPIKHILTDWCSSALLLFLSIGTLKLVCDFQDKPEYYDGLKSLGILAGC